MGGFRIIEHWLLWRVQESAGNIIQPSSAEVGIPAADGWAIVGDIWAGGNPSPNIRTKWMNSISITHKQHQIRTDPKGLGEPTTWSRKSISALSKNARKYTLLRVPSNNTWKLSTPNTQVKINNSRLLMSYSCDFPSIINYQINNRICF